MTAPAVAGHQAEQRARQVAVRIDDQHAARRVGHGVDEQVMQSGALAAAGLAEQQRDAAEQFVGEGDRPAEATLLADAQRAAGGQPGSTVGGMAGRAATGGAGPDQVTSVGQTTDRPHSPASLNADSTGARQLRRVHGGRPGFQAACRGRPGRCRPWAYGGKRL
jgi:hypothetical protein